MKKTASGNWGGSAAAGGISFQARVSAVCMVHIARGIPLGWCDGISDVPIILSAETAGAGDDIGLRLTSGSELEIQAKQKLRANDELWVAILKLCQRAHDDASFYGVLAVGPSTSGSIREHLARDVIRLGQGRMDDLSDLGAKLVGKLNQAGIALTSCSRVRIHTIHVLEQDGASSQAALAHLSHITSSPDAAWSRFQEEGVRLIQLRGNCDALSLSGIIPGLRRDSTSPTNIANSLIEWTLNSTKEFSVPAVETAFSLDDDWIELKASGRDKPNLSTGSLEDALTRYHNGDPKKNRHADDEKFDAETLGYFVRQCVIVAGPGMGKTLLLRRMARLLARKRQPVLIIGLRKLAERMRVGDTFVEAAMRIGLDGFSKSPSEVLSLGHQNLTFLLDGLDEAGGTQEAIATGAVALVASYPRCRVVFATRPIGYETPLLGKWRHYELLPFDASDAAWKVERLVAAAPHSDDKEVEKAKAGAIAHLKHRRRECFVAKSPLITSLLAALALNKVVSAETREGLYGQLFRLIAQIAAKKTNNCAVSQPVLNAFLEYLGWDLTTNPHVDIEQTLGSCANYLADELGVKVLQARSMCEQALNFWETAGFVERIRFRTNEALTFVHKTFGEFAAAQYLVARSESEREALLEVIEQSSQWDEALVFASSLGIGSALVNCALRRQERSKSEVLRALRWATYSRDQLDLPLANTLLASALAIIEGPHSENALEVGLELFSASSKLPATMELASLNIRHDQWWTALIARAYLANCSPATLDISDLLSFWSSYLAKAGTRPLHTGLVLRSRPGSVWEQLLLVAAREARHRGSDIEKQMLIERMRTADGRPLGFFGGLRHILVEAGIELRDQEQLSVASKFLGPEYFEKTKRDLLLLLEAVSGGLPKLAITVEKPFLHLSSFLHSADLMFVETPDLSDVDPMVISSANELLALTGRVLAEDHALFIAEVQEKIRELRTGDPFESYDGIVHVDANPVWGNGQIGEIEDKVMLGLQHPSSWVVQLAANLAEHHCSTSVMDQMIPQALAKFDGIGLAGVAYLANSFLGEDAARSLMVERLRAQLNSGCQYLYRMLSTAWNNNLDKEVAALVRPGLFYGPRTADACVLLVRACDAEERKEMAALLWEAYDYWIEAEGPYPENSGAVPESPRESIIGLLIDDDEASNERLFEAAHDRRSEVTSAARKALGKSLAVSDMTRAALLERIGKGEPVLFLLTESLSSRAPFSPDQVRTITDFLQSPTDGIRHAAMGVLTPTYLQCEEISSWCQRLALDPLQQIRNKAHEQLGLLKAGEK